MSIDFDNRHHDELADIYNRLTEIHKDAMAADLGLYHYIDFLLENMDEVNWPKRIKSWQPPRRVSQSYKGKGKAGGSG